MNDLPADYREVRSRDGVRLCVRTGGRADALPIVFLHGFAQSHLSWSKQFAGELAREFRLVAFDLRGHGWSGKPEDPAAYRERSRWSDDVAAVIDALGLERPVLVGWSTGGRVLCDVLATRGAAGLAGLNFVGGVFTNADEHFAPDIALVGETVTPDPLGEIDASRLFVRACFAERPPQDDFERMIAYNAMMPARVRELVFGLSFDASALLGALEIPVLFTHGSDDRLVLPAMSRYGAFITPKSRLSIYDGVGHSPFYEAPERFDRELAEFVRGCAV